MKEDTPAAGERFHHGKRARPAGQPGFFAAAAGSGCVFPRPAKLHELEIGSRAAEEQP